MRIFELYQESGHGTFTHDGTVYDLNKLLRLADDLDIDEIPVDQLDWVLEYDDAEDDHDRVANADLTSPILVTWWWDGEDEDAKSQLVVLDGLHRVARADNEGVKILPGRYIDRDMLDRCIDLIK